MSRKRNLISNIVYLGLTMVSLFAIIMICNDRYSETAISLLIKLVLGAILAGIVNTFAHELGHYFAGKKNGFAFVSMNVWFFKWTKRGKKTQFDFCMIGEEAGYTEMIPTKIENLSDGLKKMTRGGVVASFFMMLIGIPPLFLSSLPVWVFCIWSVFLPVGVYFFFGTVMPMTNEGVYNDGAVLYGIKHNEDTMQVAISVLKIQAEMYNGKTPSEIDEKLYFEVPQLPEDDVNFALILNARYNYYLDKRDFDNAKKVSDRLMGIIDYLPKAYRLAIKTDALYNACTFDFNEETADDLMYELEKFLNSVNTMNTVRAKLAYILNVRKEKDGLDIFYKKGIKEANRCQIKGYAAFERKLFDDLMKNFN